MVAEYNDYIVVIAALDAEWSRAVSTPQTDYVDEVWSRMLGTHCKIAKAAIDYATKVEEHQKAWLTGNADTLAQNREWKAKIDDRLFSAQTWLPFGHLDALSLFAVDDLDAAHAVIERYSGTVEEVTTAFCPRMTAYSDLAGDAKHLIADFLDLSDPRPGQRKPLETPSKQQRERPLAILSRLRLAPFLSMGRALVSQAAMFRLMTRAVAAGYDALKGELNRKTEKNEKPLFSKADIDSVRICFLDLQDEEEIGVFVTGKNYSAMMALIAAIQNLSVDKLIDLESDAALQLFSCRALRELLNLEKPEQGVSAESYLGQSALSEIRDSHLFRWSRSVAAAAPHLSKKDAKRKGDARPSGIIEFQTLVGVMVGHQADGEKILSKVKPAHTHLTDRKPPFQYRLHTLGTNDLVLRWKSRDKKKPAETVDLISITDAIGVWPSLLQEQQKHQRQGDRRDFTGWSSLISIPVPEAELFHPEVGKKHRHVLHELMGQLKSTDNLYCLKEEEIRKATGLCGFPVVSRRPLVFLSQNFHQVTSNPLIFDVVLDFIDILETLAFVLCERLPEFVKKNQERPSDYSLRPPEEMVEQLDEILGALDDAFALRLRRIYPEDPVRDWSLDLRSQNHQSLLAADAVLKCAVGIFRKDVLGIHKEKLEDHPDANSVRRSLGVVLRLKFQSGMNARYFKAFRLPPDTNPYLTEEHHNWTHLAVFEGDFPHLRSTLVYADFFHESFHLIFEELASRDSSTDMPNLGENIYQLVYQPEARNNAQEAEDIVLASREMFVHMMMLLFIFDGDRELLIRDHLQAVSQSTTKASKFKKGGEARWEESAERLAELVFHAIGPITWLEHTLGTNWKKTHGATELCMAQRPRGTSQHPTVSSFVEKVWNTLNLYQHAFPDFTHILGRKNTKKRTAAKRAFLRRVGVLYSLTFPYLSDLWMAARAIFGHHVTRITAERSPDTEYVSERSRTPASRMLRLEGFDPQSVLLPALASSYRELQRAVDKKIDLQWGEDRSTGAYSPIPACFDGHGIDLPVGEAIDANLIVRRSLYRYLKIHRSGDPKRRNNALPRAENGAVDCDALAKDPYAPFLVDRTSVNHFSCVPSERRKRLGQDIAALKTMWGVASRNRARRLVSLIRNIRKDGATD